MKNLYNLVVVGNQKAIVGLVLALIGGIGLQVGGVNVLDATVREVVNAGVLAVVTAGGVWVKANK